MPESAAEGDEPKDPPLLKSPPPQQQLHPLSQMTMHVYPFPHSLAPTQQQPLIRAKRRQVKNACTNCQKACKKCDDARPCLRCVKYGISDDCVDSQRKERKRGVKRGPYKKRDGKDRAGSNVDQDDLRDLSTAHSATVVQPPPITEPSNLTSPCPPVGYPQGFYSHYQPVVPAKQTEGMHVCAPGPQPYFLASIPHVHDQLYPVHSPEGDEYCPPALYFPSISYHHSPHPPIRQDHASVHVSDSYPVYPLSVYPKQTVGGHNEMVNGSKNERPGLLLNTKPH